MKTYTIEKVPYKTSIHSLASEHYDRVIKFKGNTQYAIVEADYYGGKGYVTFVTQDACVKYARKLSKNLSYEIIDVDGNKYTAYWDELILIRK